MVKLFGDYQDQVLQSYKERAAANNLSPRLIRPTPAELKNECFAVCSERYRRSDDHTLRAFFGKSGDQDTCLEAIEELSIGRFKSLINFMKEETSDPKEKIIELLAWLIDFQPRPFEMWKKNSPGAAVVQTPTEEKKPEKETFSSGEGSSENREVLSKPDPVKTGDAFPPKPPVDEKVSGKPESKSQKKAIILAIIVMAISIGIVSYWTWRGKTTSNILTGNEKCMYWAGDHYEPVSCSQKMDGILVLALDSERLTHFKKITRWDTVTLKSKGLIWYAKIKGNIELYTKEGFHPTDLQQRLRPMTEYIYYKYIVGNNN